MYNHHKEFHKEDKYLNCNVHFIGKYYSNCMQKAILQKDSFAHMLINFIGDYFHYDGKFKKTVKTMFIQPNAVAIHYINNKRVKHVNPISFYSATILFFILNAVETINQVLKLNNSKKLSITTFDSYELNNTINTKKEKAQLYYTKKPIALSINNKTQLGIGKWIPHILSLAAYLLHQNNLPTSEKDGWIKILIKQFLLFCFYMFGFLIHLFGLLFITLFIL